MESPDRFNIDQKEWKIKENDDEETTKQ